TIAVDFKRLDQFCFEAHVPIWIIVLARVVGVCMTAPVNMIPGVHWAMRFALAMTLGLFLVPVIEPMVGPVAPVPRIAWIASTEVSLGGLRGMSAGLIVHAARQAGDLVAAQAGLSSASLLDPDSGVELTPLGYLYGAVALAVFLALDGPLIMIGAL